MKKLLFLLFFMTCGTANAEGLIVDALDPVSLNVKDIEKLNKQNELILPTFNQLDLVQRSKFALYELANHEVITNTYVFKADGKLEYLGSKLAASGQKILFQQDYTSYKNVDVNGKRKKVGILLRLEAELVTKKADLNLNGIFAIGAAASSGSVSGRLRLKVYGLSGEAISLAIPAPSDISEQSLLNAFTAIATIKSKIYEDNVFVIPQDIPELPFELGRNQS